jgi:hypothetical protein
MARPFALVLCALLGSFVLAACAMPATAPGPTPELPTAVPVLPGTQDQTWLTVRQPTPAYSIHGDQLWIATPGSWYRVVERKPGWLLAVAEGDTDFWSVWIEQDARIQLSSGRGVEPTR